MYGSLQLCTSRFILFRLVARNQCFNPFRKCKHQGSFINCCSIRVIVGKLLVDILIDIRLLIQYRLGLITDDSRSYISFSLSFIINKGRSTRMHNNLRAGSISFNSYTILVNIVLGLQQIINLYSQQSQCQFFNLITPLIISLQFSPYISSI